MIPTRVGANIHCHILAETTVGIAQGINMTARNGAPEFEPAVHYQGDDESQHCLQQNRDNGENERILNSENEITI